MGLLDGNLAASIYRGFKGKLLKGIIRRSAVPTGATLDALGDPSATIPADAAIEGFTDNYSRFTQAQAGIPATDLKLYIFAGSAPGFVPMIGDRARLDRRNGAAIASQWYQIRGPINIDPARVLWECQSFEIAAPNDGSF